MKVRWIVLPFLFLLNSACVFYPKEAEKQPYADSCLMNTRQLTLEFTGPVTVCAGEHEPHSGPACLIWAGIIPLGSLVVSGSVVLVSNTVHWLEYQGECQYMMTSNPTIDLNAVGHASVLESDWYSRELEQFERGDKNCDLQIEELRQEVLSGPNRAAYFESTSSIKPTQGYKNGDPTQQTQLK